jgi:DHA3 family tetracycline resistance protein-like MFS transporter
VAQTESATRATVFSAVGVVSAGGEIAGGPPIGWLGTRFTLGRALLTSALLTAPAVAFLSAALARQKASDRPGPQ